MLEKGAKLIISGIVITVLAFLIGGALSAMKINNVLFVFLAMLGTVILIVGIILVIKSKVNSRREKVSHQREDEEEKKQVFNQSEGEEDKEDDTSLDILKKRLAKGEISKEEFDNIKKDVT